MSVLIFFVIVAVVVRATVGSTTRRSWRREIERAVQPELNKLRRHPNMPARYRLPPLPPPRILGRSTLPPPPTGEPVEFDDGRPRSLPPIEDQVEAVVEEVAPPPEPDDPIVIDVPVPATTDWPESGTDDAGAPPETAGDERPTLDPGPRSGEGPTPDPGPRSDDRPTEPVALDLASTIAALFDRNDPPHTRADRFADAYAGRTIEWSVVVLRTSRSRRDHRPATRAELLLGQASDRGFYSDRVIGEAYLPADLDLGRDAEVTMRGTLTGVNVYANRLVLDACEII
ncbi:MAG: hypothetical protein AAGA90_10515 [Actinomycetota bacterium]